MNFTPIVGKTRQKIYLNDIIFKKIKKVANKLIISNFFT